MYSSEMIMRTAACRAVVSGTSGSADVLPVFALRFVCSEPDVWYWLLFHSCSLYWFQKLIIS